MGVTDWWVALSAVAVLNIAVWSAMALSLRRRPGDPVRALRRRQLLLSAPFVFGCAFRSWFPRADVQRICLVDSWLSSVALGRSVATIAELCFAAQCALFLRQVAIAARLPAALRMSRVLLSIIGVAEIFSWYAVITTNYAGNASEESLWAMMATLLFFGLALCRRRLTPPLRSYLGYALVVVAGYVVFMCTVDVPMYVARWQADEAAGKTYLSFAEGLRDVASRWVVTRRLEDWREEMPWMFLYFSVGVWFSLALVRAPYPTLLGMDAGRR